MGWLWAGDRDFEFIQAFRRAMKGKKNPEAKRLTCQFKGNKVHAQSEFMFFYLLEYVADINKKTFRRVCSSASTGETLDADDVFRLKKEFSLTCSLVLAAGQWSWGHHYLCLCVVSFHQRSVRLLCGKKKQKKKRMSSCYQMSVFALVSKVWAEIREAFACQWGDRDAACIRRVWQCFHQLESVWTLLL